MIVMEFHADVACEVGAPWRHQGPPAGDRDVSVLGAIDIGN